MRAGVQSLWSIDFRFPRFPSSQAHAFTISNTTSKDLNLIPCNFQHFVTMAPTYTLYSPAGSFRAFAPLIAAEYNGVNVNVDTEGVEAAVAAKSPTGKAPILETPNGVIFSSAAMARYVAGLRRDTGLLGNSLQEQAAVDSWMDWCAQDIELPACVWWYPVAGYMPSNEDAAAKAQADLGAALEILNNYLNDKTYMVNDQITLADITIACTLLYPFKLVCDKAFIKPYGNVVRWFMTCVNQPEFAAVVGKVEMCKKSLAAPAAGGKKGAKKEKKEAEVVAEAPAPPPKVEHPYKIMDKEFPSKFNMDGWKKQYSNAKVYQTAMDYFWENFDSEGYSLWLQVYNFNEENKRTFMTSNAVGGFQQRTEEIRKWSFGVMDVVGTEETSLEIRGIWLLRGDSTDCMVAANDDANWYTWTKLAGKGLAPSDEVKTQVAAYWCEEEELEGKIIQDSKVFK